MKNKNNILFSAFLPIILLIFVASFLSACSRDDITGTTDNEDAEIIVDDADFVAADWSAATHGNDADPDFDEVFEDESVKRFDFVISPDRWQIMLDDMTANYGEFGGGGGPSTGPEDNPVFVPAEVYYNDTQWYRVGLRFKGNSSLRSSWQEGILKLSFKLDFDEFEDDYPQIDNQRFYGFKKLSLKNNYEDKSMLREKVAGDVFRNFGLAGAHTAFYALYVDHGDGPQYFGLYALVEEVDDTVLDSQFADSDGNLYKPDGTGASFMDGTFSEDVFVKKTNEDDSDWTDILELFAALNDETRTTAPSTWRTNLEAVFDTEVFLKYLAVNTVVQNWDTYGRMTHNYYLYNNPETGLLTWINWDNNEALNEGKRGGSQALDFSTLDSGQWPLIEYLYEDDVYQEQYKQYVEQVIDGPFAAASMQSLYSTHSAVVEPYATVEIDGYTFLNSAGDYYLAISELASHASARTNAVNIYLE